MAELFTRKMKKQSKAKALIDKEVAVACGSLERGLFGRLLPVQFLVCAQK